MPGEWLPCSISFHQAWASTSLGRLRVRELTTGAIDRHLRVVRDKHGAGTAKLTRTVLSGICGLAARYDALDRNHRGMSVARGGPGQGP